MAVADYSLTELAADIGPRYAELRQAAEIYEDHQKTRIAQANRIASMTVDVSTYAEYAEMLKRLEEQLSKRLVRIYRDTAPAGVIEWQKGATGVGEHMLARLLGQLGHPRLATPKYWARNTTIGDAEFGDESNPKRMLVDGEPFLRSLAQLRQYCGHGRADRRRKGMSQEDALALGKPDCKMIVHLMAEGVVKSQVRKDPDAPYREMANADKISRVPLGDLGAVYLDTRETYAQRGHLGPCSGGWTTAGKKVVFSKCKVDGRYADIGDAFAPSHINAIAQRHLGKRILEELYDAAREEWC